MTHETLLQPNLDDLNDERIQDIVNAVYEVNEDQKQAYINYIKQQIDALPQEHVLHTMRTHVDTHIAHYETDFYLHDVLLIMHAYQDTKPLAFVWLVRDTGTYLLNLRDARTTKSLQSDTNTDTWYIDELWQTIRKNRPFHQQHAYRIHTNAVTEIPTEAALDAILQEWRYFHRTYELVVRIQQTCNQYVVTWVEPNGQHVQQSFNQFIHAYAHAHTLAVTQQHTVHVDIPTNQLPPVTELKHMCIKENTAILYLVTQPYMDSTPMTTYYEQQGIMPIGIDRIQYELTCTSSIIKVSLPLHSFDTLTALQHLAVWIHAATHDPHVHYTYANAFLCATS